MFFREIRYGLANQVFKKGAKIEKCKKTGFSKMHKKRPFLLFLLFLTFLFFDFSTNAYTFRGVFNIYISKTDLLFGVKKWSFSMKNSVFLKNRDFSKFLGEKSGR